jgi:alpha-L-fucosidase 2
VNADDRGCWSQTETSSWEGRLISGSGRLGALVACDPVDEVITLSHERLFLPLERPLPPVHMAERLARVRELLLEGHCQATADAVAMQAEHEGYGDELQGRDPRVPGFPLRWSDPLVPGFDLRLRTTALGAIQDYRRGVNFSTGVVTVCWADDRGRFARRLFASRPDDIVVLAINGPGHGQVDVAIQVASTPPDACGPHDDHIFSEGIEDVAYGVSRDMLSYCSHFRRAWPGSLRGYAGVVRVVATGGTMKSDGRGVIVTGADEVVVLAALDVSGTPALPLSDLQQRLRGVEPDFERLLARHTAVHADLVTRSRLNLGGEPERGLPSEELLALSRRAGLRPALLEKEFDAGRYAIISSCGELPPTLRGVWTATWDLGWSGHYVHNGNTQTALASLLSTGTPELLKGYFSYLESLLGDMRENARRLYACRGIHLPAHTSTRGLQNHFNELWCHEFWTAGAGWAARFFYDYWQYTGDDEFLAKHAMPFMEEVAAFYEDFLVDGPDGRYIFAPSYSPENNPGNSSSQACVNATMDIAVAKDLLRSLMAASEALHVNAGKVPRWAEMLTKMPAYAISQDGTLAEWVWPDVQQNQAHRHASHLYPVMYEVDPEIASRPDLLEACRRAVLARMAWRRGQDGGEMAFGLVQLGLSAAHLHMADTAYEIIELLATRYWRPSLVPTHDPGAIFNVDLAGGLPAVVAEMLVQSSRGSLDLLPALPEQWERGAIEGIACRGQVIVDSLAWDPGSARAVIRSAKTQTLMVTFPAEMRTMVVRSPVGQTMGESMASSQQLCLLAGAAVTVEASRGP